MIILHSFACGFSLPEISPLVTTTKSRLKMAYRRRHATRSASPRGRRLHIGLGTLQRALAWALERMIEHYLDWALAGARWADRKRDSGGKNVHAPT
jgi:hypothetical protein